MNQLSSWLLLVLLLPIWASAQTPFKCDGNIYMTQVEEQKVTTLFELEEDGQVINALPFPITNDYNVNAIGYRKTDNLIYGLEPILHELYRIDAAGRVESLGYMPLKGAYFAGDVSPSGGELVLFNSKNIAKINLNTLQVSADSIPLIVPDSAQIFCTDVAFHPITGELYGYNGVAGQLVIINSETGEVNNTKYPSIGYRSTLPALFFNAIGELYGIGTDNVNDLSILFKFDLETGMAQQRYFSETPGDRDACSCPYTVTLQEYTTTPNVYPCTEAKFVFKISNLKTIQGLLGDLYCELPDDFLITEILHNPFEGNLNNSIGSDILNLTDMTIPLGVDSIVVTAIVPKDASGTYLNQSRLTAIDLATQSSIDILSDYPFTFEKNDATPIQVLSLGLDNNIVLPDTSEICSADSLIFDMPDIGGIEYFWSTLETGTSIDVYSEGYYQVTITSPCDTLITGTELIYANMEVDLGLTQTIFFGNTIDLVPEVKSFSPLINFDWRSSLEDLILCPTCTGLYNQMPQEDITYSVTVKNAAGCTASASVDIIVERPIFAPNAFSPNTDGINVYFYLQSAGAPMDINLIQVYNRWGALMYEQKNISTNDELAGWNGEIRNQSANQGIYIWVAEIQLPSGETQQLSGDVLLMK